MSRFACNYGKLISDNTDALPYKASMIADVNINPFFDWLQEATESFVAAARDGKVDAWQLAQGYPQEYVDLRLSHGAILHDHIHSRYIDITRDLYECTQCGRIHIERSANNRLANFAPEDGMYQRVLAGDPSYAPDDAL